MNNDLISRSALIQHAYSAVVDGVEKDIIDLSDVDNSPAISIDWGIDSGDRTVYIRPQGEWITTRTMIHDGNPYCSICDEENIIRSKFCPNCGASMMKGGET